MEGIENKEMVPEGSIIEDKSKIRKRNGWDYEDSNNRNLLFRKQLIFINLIIIYIIN